MRDIFSLSPKQIPAVLGVLLAAAPLQAAPGQAVPAAGAVPRAAAPRASSPNAAGWARVIVRFTRDPSPGQWAALRALHAAPYRRLPLIHGAALDVPRRALARLAALPFVAHVSPDAPVARCDEFTVGSSGAGAAQRQYGVDGSGVTVAVLDSGIAEHEDLNTPAQKGDEEDDDSNGSHILLHQDMTGTPYTTTGYQDDGAKAHADKGGDARQAHDGKAPQVVYDLCGHGTHVAGIIGGSGRASTGKRFFHTFYGVAPGVSLVDVRVLDKDGRADVSTVVAGIQWVVSYNASATGSARVRVINLSLGHPVGESYATDPLCQAVEAAYHAGIVVVCAAGNSGRASAVNDPAQSNEGWGTAYGSINSPGDDPSVITVGAMKQDPAHAGDRTHDRIATYSGRGPSRLDLVLKPDLVAPGNRVISLEASLDYLSTRFDVTNQVPLSSYLHTNQAAPSSTYFSLSGTSMASPVVAGAAALLLQASPNLTPDTVKARLMLSADKWNTPSGSPDPLTYGAGYLDVPAALASTATATMPALSPTLALNADGTVSLVMDRAAWGTSLWGTGVADLRAAWGTSVTFAPGVDASRAAWGTNTLASSRAAWGTSAVWSDRAAWGTSTSAVDLSSVALAGEQVPSGWGAKAAGGGANGRTPVLWANADGTAAVWSADAAGGFTQHQYGPYPGWAATALAAGPDGRAYLLWAGPQDRATLWALDGQGGFTQHQYGPYPGWAASALAVGPDGVPRLSWVRADGTLSLWAVGADGGFTQHTFGPYAGWKPGALSVAPDNTTHVLWGSADGRASVWNYGAATGAFTQTTYGPYPGWTARSVADGPDGRTRLLWDSADGHMSLWSLDNAAGTFTQHTFGPYAGWTALSVSAGPDNVSHVLWDNADGRLSLWDYSAADGSFTQNTYGPY